jgi:hypothetical protein
VFDIDIFMAATPVVTGTGFWSIVSGPGVITNPASPTTTVTGVTAGNGSIPTILQWTVSNGSCASTSDQVSLINYASPTVANAGADQEDCAGDFTLAGNAAVSGTGVWSIVGLANGAVIGNPSDPVSTVTGLTAGSSVTLRWTISNGVCSDSFDEVILTHSDGAGCGGCGVGPGAVFDIDIFAGGNAGGYRHGYMEYPKRTGRDHQPCFTDNDGDGCDGREWKYTNDITVDGEQWELWCEQ